jgi:hypothetical protein
MTGLFDDPYKYVIDSSALFDLKRNYPPTVFKGVWDNFEKMCNSLEIISVREVKGEVEKGMDWLVEWAKEHPRIFLEPTYEELSYVGELQEKYPHLIDYNSDRPAADPFVIACARQYKIKIIQHEKLQNNKQKLPFVAKHEGLECILLTQLFELEKWEF